MARRSKKGNSVKVNFKGVETRVLLPEGIYLAKVASVEQEAGEKADYLKWTFRTIDDDPKLNDKPLYNNTSLAPQSLWVLGNLLETLGIEVPDGSLDIDFEELTDLELALVVEHEEYQGKRRAKVVDFGAPDIAAGDDDEETVTVDDDTNEESTYTEEEINDMDADELAEVVEENELKVKKVKKLETYRKNVLKALEEADLLDSGEEEDEDEDEDENEDGDEATYTEEEINEMDEDALDELVEEHDLKVKKLKKIARYRANVIKALEEADMIGEAEESDEDEGFTEDEVNEMDADELKELIKELELDVKPLKAIKKFRAKVIEALEEAELLVDDEDE